jgi:indolepyruvate ferredoxin oxidoreductase
MPLTEAAARSLFKLMAYKDEYEVARLYTDGAFEKRLWEEFEGDTRVQFHFAAPLLSRRDRRTGELRKSTYGAWILPGLRLLARLRRLRGTRWDVFGYTIERRAERALIASYEATLEQVTRALRPDNLQRAIAIARLPLEIRGYGHIKWPAIEHYQRTVAAQMTELSRPATAAIDARHGAHT